LTPGQRGEAIRDLQRRLGAAGYPLGNGAEAGVFCGDTETSLRAFQAARGLRADGRCDQETWTGLVEASWKLGDRLLFLTAPNLRGDDVAELQQRLGKIGFDCGKVDGILGPLTADALLDFQSNCGLVVDGTCGPVTLRAIERVSRQTSSGPGVAMVREREGLRTTSSSLRGLRVVIGQFGGLTILTRVITRELRLCGSIVVSVDEPDARAQAATANSFGASIYVGFEARPDQSSSIWYYAVPGFESEGGRSLAQRLPGGVRGVPRLEPGVTGRRPPGPSGTKKTAVPGFESTGGRSLAERLADGLCAISGLDPCVIGLRHQVLRETKMPAVLASLGSVRRTVDLSGEVTSIVRDALEDWAAKPL